MRTRAIKLAVCGVVLVAVSVTKADLIQVPLNYNFNGMVHFGEEFDPDNPDGYRSISDRGLDLFAGVPSHPVLDNYFVVPDPGGLDIVHLGNRNTVDGGRWAFDPKPDGDDIGIQPNWLPDPDQTGTQTTVLSPPILLDANSFAAVIFQISNGGGSFDVRFGFRSGDDVVATLVGPDWFGPFGGMPNIGEFFGTQDTDTANPGPTLLLTEGIVDLSAHAGRELVSIGFENRTNTRGGYAIIAVNVEGTLATRLLGDLNCDDSFNGGDIDPFFLALGDPAQYQQQFPNCDILLGDMNCDGRVDGGDIDEFFRCLGIGGCTCP